MRDDTLVKFLQFLFLVSSILLAIFIVARLSA